MNSKINPSLLQKLAESLFAEPLEQERFREALLHGGLSEKAILWCGTREAQPPFPVLPAAPWQPDFVDRVPAEIRPGGHPLHEQGAYYCLDLSSVFAASVLQCITVPHRVVLDVCSAPGGKGIFAWRALSPGQLICNEVIGKRLGSLISNLKRCRITPACVIQHDTRILAARLPVSVPVLIVDAPCSGQSLLAKGEESPGCLHPASINMNSNRQKRILANSLSIVAPGGYLAYMTCTYSRQENEGVVEWALKKFPQFRTREVTLLEQHRSHLSAQYCYRLWPQEGLGAGSFVSLFENTDAGEVGEVDLGSLNPVWSS